MKLKSSKPRRVEQIIPDCFFGLAGYDGLFDGNSDERDWRQESTRRVYSVRGCAIVEILSHFDCYCDLLRCTTFAVRQQSMASNHRQPNLYNVLRFFYRCFAAPYYCASDDWFSNPGSSPYFTYRDPYARARNIRGLFGL